MTYTVTTDWARPGAGAAKEGDIEIMEIQVAAAGGSPRPEPGLDLVPASDVSAERTRIRRELEKAIDARSFKVTDSRKTKGVVVGVAVLRLALDRICPEEG